MRSAVESSIHDFNTEYEADIPWMYLDIRGLVTLGSGKLVDESLNPEDTTPWTPALNIPFIRTGGYLATQQEIIDGWHKVKSAQWLAKAGHVPAQNVCDLRITPETSRNITSTEAARYNTILVKHFSRYEDAPADAQLMVMSMAWAMGPDFALKFPRFTALFNAENFAEYHYDVRGNVIITGGCASQCWIQDHDNPGVTPRNIANQRLAINASQVVKFGLSREVLHFPAIVADQVTITAANDVA